ncbi:MAG: LysE family transporter [Bacteroidales bacterium]|nr:LysE family transporter [Bacteroidales bacterium]
MEILRALLVGVIAAIPFGPILVMVVQRTLCHDRKTGLMVGLGAAMGDMVYAGVGLLTLELIKRFVLDHEGVFLLVGGLIIGLIGAGMCFREVSLSLPADKRQVSSKSCVLQAFTTTLSNPAALATMLALLTGFRLGGGVSRTPLWLLIPMVGLGEFLYWTLVTWLLSRYLRINEKTLRVVSRIAGGLVFAFAVVLVVRGLMMILGD